MENLLTTDLYIKGQPQSFNVHYNVHPRTGRLTIFRLERQSDGQEFDVSNWRTTLRRKVREHENQLVTA